MSKSAVVTLTALTTLTLAVWIFVRPILPCRQIESIEVARYCFTQATRLEPVVNFLAQLTDQAELKNAAKVLRDARPFLGYEDFFLGLNQVEPTTYLVLLQNDTELRANGGFAGSYAVISARDGQFDTRFQDIYVPDGQLPGHVDPPEPIQAAFKQGWWKLRDADWYPDFPSSATTIRWFFKNGGEIDPDALITLNLKSVQAVFDITGPVDVPEYQLVIDGDNVYQILQTQAEHNFFPGSTQKRDALVAIGKAFLDRIGKLDSEQKLEIAALVLDQLDRQNILVHTKDPRLQDLILAKNWGGQLAPQGCLSIGCIDDSMAIVETNLGANKANCCVTRLTSHEISAQGDHLIHKIKLAFTNSSYTENPVPPDFYGGNYIQYLRLYLPTAATFVTINPSPTIPLSSGLTFPTGGSQLETGMQYGFTEYGFFHSTKAQSQSEVVISYSLPLEGRSNYQLSLLKQHGLTSSPQVIYLFGKLLQTELEYDYQIQQNLP